MIDNISVAFSSWPEFMLVFSFDQLSWQLLIEASTDNESGLERTSSTEIVYFHGDSVPGKTMSYYFHGDPVPGKTLSYIFADV